MRLPPSLVALLLSATVAFAQIPAADITTWPPHPAAWKGASLAGATAALTADKWSSLRSPNDLADAQISATVTITEAAKSTTFFGQSWSAWPDPLSATAASMRACSCAREPTAAIASNSRIGIKSSRS